MRHITGDNDELFVQDMSYILQSVGFGAGEVAALLRSRVGADVLTLGVSLLVNSQADANMHKFVEVASSLKNEYGLQGSEYVRIVRAYLWGLDPQQELGQEQYLIGNGSNGLYPILHTVFGMSEKDAAIAVQPVYRTSASQYKTNMLQYLWQYYGISDTKNQNIGHDRNGLHF